MTQTIAVFTFAIEVIIVIFAKLGLACRLCFWSGLANARGLTEGYGTLKSSSDAAGIMNNAIWGEGGKYTYIAYIITSIILEVHLRYHLL